MDCAIDEWTWADCAIDLTTGRVVAPLRCETAVREVLAERVLGGRRYPALLDDEGLENLSALEGAGSVNALYLRASVRRHEWH